MYPSTSRALFVCAALAGAAGAHACAPPTPSADGSVVDANDALEDGAVDEAAPDAGDAREVTDGGADGGADGDALVADAGLFVPTLAGPFQRVYAPSGGRYLNDHTLARGPDGRWHVYGITDTSRGSPFEEGEFLHAIAPSLEGPWADQADALVADARLDGCCIWAPYAFEASPGRWLMYFFAAQSIERGLRRAESTDLTVWTRTPSFATDSGRPPGGRDPFVLRDGDRWLLYSVGVTPTSNGQILVSESRDIDGDGSSWSAPHAVLTDPVPSFGWGNLESPFVVLYERNYYLFTTRTGMDSGETYWDTNVFVSNDPRNFAWRPITRLHTHAAEIVRADDRWYITSGGWTELVGEANRGLSVAPFTWAPLR